MMLYWPQQKEIDKNFSGILNSNLDLYLNYHIITGNNAGKRRRRDVDDITLHEDFEPGIKFTCKYPRIIGVDSTTDAVDETETIEDNLTLMGTLKYSGEISIF